MCVCVCFLHIFRIEKGAYTLELPVGNITELEESLQRLQKVNVLIVKPTIFIEPDKDDGLFR